MSPSRNGSKRGNNGRSPVSRARKKQKRLDAIVDKPTPVSSSLPLDSSSDNDAGDRGCLRRSSRARRAPDVLDSSPVPSNRMKKPKPSDPISPKLKLKVNQLTKEEKKKSVSLSLSFQEEDSEGWRSRLRSRATEGKLANDSCRVSKKGMVGRRKRDSLRIDEIEKKEEGDDDGGGGGRDDDDGVDKISEEEEEEKGVASESKEMETSEQVEEPKVASDLKEMEISELAEEATVASDSKELETSEQAGEAREDKGNEWSNVVQVEEQEQRQESENIVAGDEMDTKSDENATNSNAVESEKTGKGNYMTLPISEEKLSSKRVKEGRRCGLCGGGTDGKPPKKLARESVESDNEAYEGSSASEEPNYDIWDGFGDEPGWLGRLLGPIHDRFGIARVWVHQHCAVWSPEVYFAGLGCLKNVRAALCRGRALKCSRCGRPGATIGCRVDRCPKTYHLPCSRAEGCIFDHRKFLIACHDHRHLFQPQGINYSLQIRKRKARKLKLEMRKLSNDAWRKDLEAEEKWLEHCGEDEEFLKREGKRLHRDILRIAPTYIGGSSESEKLYEGWESVAGLKDVIRCMKEVVILPLLYPEFFSNIGLTPPRGVLLHGYPGTGKTLVVRALIGECSRGDKRIAYFARKGADCLGKYVGDAERQLRLLFQVAEKSQPSIIFFDEIDGLAPSRSRHQDQTHSSVVSTLLSLLDGLKSRGSVIVIGATNRPDAVDPALRRPGRFDREIYFPLPSEKDRSAILSLHTRNWPNPLSGTLLSWIANKTVGYAGADLKALCTHAAMSALKRNCALKELLSSAEKGFIHGKLPSLPSLIVEERDWLEALALAPPPCSRREAGMAANDVVSSPLSTHLTPCLIKPLSLLLISFCNEGRIWLPPVLYKASRSIRNIIISSLENRRLPIASWWSHVHHLVQEKCVVKEIEGTLSRYGLVIGPSGGGDSILSDDDNDKHEKSNSFTFGLSGKSMKRLPLKLGNSYGGFRLLISGSPRCGQQHLASCLLHVYMGHVEIQKVNLATMSQEEHGDLFRGLTQIISKCLNLGRCIIYMPRIDLWAINANPREDTEQSQTTPMTSKSSVTESDGRYTVSDIWNSFVEEVDSACKSASLIIMATCEIQTRDLPFGIKQFFSSDVMSADSSPTVHTIPRFFVHIDGSFDHELILNSSAAKLSHDLVQNYVQLVHQKTHLCKYQNKIKLPNSSEIDYKSQKQSIADGEKTGLMDTTKYPDQIASSHQELFPKNLYSKASRGSSALAIAAFGYQILRCPQFAELCWVTSKLREGPSTDVNGPWKSWPFNSCVIQGCSSSPDKTLAERNLSIHKEKVNSGVVRGLTAVGLLSYRSVYTSVVEVAVEVRKVLELLVGQIRAKISAGKDRYQYFRILSQVAYIEDLVNSWAYTYQSSHMNNPTNESNTKPVSSGIVYTENNLSGSNITGIQSCVLRFSSKSNNEEQETLYMKSSAKAVASNGQCVSLSKGLSDHSLRQSDMTTIPEDEHIQEGVSSSLPSSAHLSEGTPLGKRMDNLKQLNGLEITESTPVLNDPNSSLQATKSSSKDVYCKGSSSVHSSRDAELVSEVPCEVSDFTLTKDDNFIAYSEISCLYICCSGCVHKLYILSREILSQCWESSGHCLTADDINNIVSTCSLNILAALRKFNISVNSNNLAVFNSHTTRPEHCTCQNRTSEDMEYLSVECSCHLRNDDEGNINGKTECDSLLRQGITFFFKKGVLVSSEPQKDDVLHCRYDKFCLCSMVEKMLTIEKPLDLCNSVAL